MPEGTRCTPIQPLIPLLLLVAAALSIGAIAWIRRARRRHAEDRLVAEATPRVLARLTGLRPGVALEHSSPPHAPAMAPAAAMAAVAMPSVTLAPAAAARPRSISAALVPWAGAGAGAGAAGVAVTQAYGLRSGEAGIMRRATAMTRDPWRAQTMPGAVGRAPADPRWRMWRDASAALVAFALVGLVLVGGDLLRLPPGPQPDQAGLLAAAVSPGHTPPPVAVVVGTPIPSVSQGPLVLTTPTPGPAVTTAPARVRVASATPPLTGRQPTPTPRPTRKPTPKPTPTPTPALDPTFYCLPQSYAVTVGQTITCDAPVSNPGATYEWLVTDPLGVVTVADSGAQLSKLTYQFSLEGQNLVQLRLRRGGDTVSSSQAAFDVAPAVP